ncbi:MAG: hypothetical protein WA364_08860 [Candidatus Nitrosopolaris sp.]|jgi:hypothetical protein
MSDSDINVDQFAKNDLLSIHQIRNLAVTNSSNNVGKTCTDIRTEKEAREDSIKMYFLNR